MTNSKPNLTVQTQEDDDDSLSSLLDLAAENNLPKFTAAINHNPAAVDEIGLWYGRSKKGSKRMVLEERTPLMVASTYGSLDVMKFILSLSNSDVNRRCGPDRTTALHCAASGGSENAADAVRILISNGADVTSLDSNGLRPADVIAVSPSMLDVKFVLEDLLGGTGTGTGTGTGIGIGTGSSASTTSSSSSSPPLSSSSYSDSNHNNLEEKREFPIDPSLPDIKNSIYATDEFRMFSFKVRPCSRAYSHDWTECPFVHPGENARRRDPRKFHYSCVPCPEFRKGACRRGDLCEYAHGVFECWLHPAQYRTRLCKDGTSCGRRVCFFAHTAEELRPLYVSTGSAVPSPRSMDVGFIPGSPGSFPLSPSAVTQSMNAWPQQQAVPSLHLPLNSRLRSSLSARDELAMLARSMQVRSKTTLNPSNLDELFVAEMSGSSPTYTSANSPPHKSSNLLNHQGVVPISIESSPSPRNPLFNSSLGIPSPRMSPRSFESARVCAQMRSLSSRDLSSNAATVGSPLSSSWSNWGSPSGKLDWGVNGEELGRLRQSMVSESGLNGEEPDVSWVQSLVNSQEAKERVSESGNGDDSNLNGQIEEHAVLGAWLEQMQLDQLVA